MTIPPASGEAVSGPITPAELRAAAKHGSWNLTEAMLLAAADALEAAERRVAELEQRVEKAEADAEQSALAAIEARNPGIDIEQVRLRRRQVRHDAALAALDEVEP